MKTLLFLIAAYSLLSAKAMVLFKSDSSCSVVNMYEADSGKFTSAGSNLQIFSKTSPVLASVASIDSIRFFDGAYTLSAEMLFNAAYAAPAAYDSANSIVTLDLRNRTVADSCIIITDPIDLMDAGNGTISNNSTIQKILVRTKATLNANSQIKAYWSSGNSFFSDSTWSAWTAADGLIFDINSTDKKYVKIRYVLKTSSVTELPKIHSLTLCADLAPASKYTKKIEISSFNNEKIITGPYPFAWEERTNSAIAGLINRFRLDTCGQDSTTEFGKVIALLDWTARRPKGSLYVSPYPWNLNSVITQSGTINGHCMSYSEVMISALTGLGLYGRHWAIEGINNSNNHEVVEYWSNTHKKWIYLDPSLDTYYKSTATDAPLSIIEMHKIYVNGQYTAIACVDAKYHYGVYTSYYNWRSQHGYTTTGHMKLTERNNFHSQPLPVYNGFGRGFCGYSDLNMWHNWCDEFTPPYNGQQYSCGATVVTCHSGRMRDFWYTINQASIKAKRNSEQTIVLEFGNSQPFFNHYEVSINNEPAVIAVSPYIWVLQNGSNSLEVTPVNNYGEKGISSSLVVVY
jgi:hypothetical protein